jgi:hypothetical protein
MQSVVCLSMIVKPRQWGGPDPLETVAPLKGVIPTNISVGGNEMLASLVRPSSTYLFTAGVKGFVISFDHSQAHATVGRTSSGRGIGPSQRPLPDNTNTHKRKKSMPPMGFETTIPASARPQTYALDRAATGIGNEMLLCDISFLLACVSMRMNMVGR